MSFPWSPGGDFGSPTYSMPIKVVDGMLSTFINERRRRWREALDMALSRWGLPFDLIRRPESDQAFVATDETISTQGLNPLVIPDAIAIVRLHVEVAVDTATWVDELGGGICLLTPWRGWWGKGDRAAIAAVAAHEIGHALGFGHGGSGVMVGAPKPNEQERQLASEFYL